MNVQLITGVDEGSPLLIAKMSEESVEIYILDGGFFSSFFLKTFVSFIVCKQKAA